MSLLDQLPRLSAYDPGAQGEGGLDPLGLGAIADRIANRLAPGVRARMSQPRFVTLSAVGAIAYQDLHHLTADDGKTTVDLAFEWLVIESMVRYPGQGRTEGLPGSQKAARAKAGNERLSSRTYLNGPRVFGFTGVYRPFSRDVGVLTLDDLPDNNADRLVSAWERGCGWQGFVDGTSNTAGGQFRKRIAEACKKTIEAAQCVTPSTGQFLKDLSECLAPREAKPNERRVLRELISTGQHEIRNELTAMLLTNIPAGDVTQRDLALRLAGSATQATRRALQAAIDYEDAASAIELTFRRFIAFASQQQGGVIGSKDALRTPGLCELVPRINALSQRAIDSVAALDDVELSQQTDHTFSLFLGKMTPGSLLETLIARHEKVQASKNKLSWLDVLRGDWLVRTPYRNQLVNMKSDNWAHPMRLVTLARFLTETA